MGNPVVLTSENAQAFYEQKMATPVVALAEPKGEELEPKEVVSDADKTGAEATQQEPIPEGKQKVHLRFSELTEQRKAAEARAEKAEADVKAAQEAQSLAEKRASEAATRARELELKLNPPKEDLGPEPQPEQFVNPKEYAKAYADWDKENTERENAKKESLAEQQRIADDHAKRMDKFVKETPDFEKIVGKTDVVLRNEVIAAIVASDYGPQIIYHYAQHPDEAEALKKLPVASQVARIGRLETLFEKPSPKAEPKAEKPVAVAHEVSRAPEPISPLSGGNAAPDSPVDSKGEFHGTYAEYKAARQAGRIK